MPPKSPRLAAAAEWDAAIHADDAARLDAMLAAGQDINARDRYGQTALMRAAHAGRTRSVAWLVSQGAELDHAAKFGLSALMLAALSGHRDIVRILAEAGANISRVGSGAPGFAGKTAADLAGERGDHETAALLRKRGGIPGG
jgi:ankyrin repeat protein